MSIKSIKCPPLSITSIQALTASKDRWCIRNLIGIEDTHWYIYRQLPIAASKTRYLEDTHDNTIMLPIVCKEEEDDSTSSSSSSLVVHFSPILITSIHNRPTTDEDDIPTLYYTARDINQFKYEYRLFVSACQRFQNRREDRKQMAAMRWY